MTTRTLAIGLLAAGALGAACMPVTGDRILGRDLALAEPALAALPATFAVSFAPAPGERRVLAPAELGRIARSHGISTSELSEICFELPVRKLSREEILAAMMRSLPSSAHVEIVELGKTDAPPGEIDFPGNGLEPADAAGNRLWRGSVRYASTRKLAVWARVKVFDEYTAVVAARDIPAGVVVEEGWLRLEKQSGVLPREPIARRIEDAAGLVLKRPVKSGAPLQLATLSVRLAVRRGETVRVDVASGWARLHFEAVAESDAREGDQIALRNPISGKTFRAKVGGNGRATVVIGGPAI